MTVPCMNRHEKMRGRNRVLMPRMVTFMGELEPSDGCHEGAVMNVAAHQCRAY